MMDEWMGRPMMGGKTSIQYTYNAFVCNFQWLFCTHMYICMVYLCHLELIHRG